MRIRSADRTAFFALKDRWARFTVLLVNARHLKQVPGRKSDIRDCQWLAQLLQHGLLKGSFIPLRPQRELPDLTRYRTQLVEAKPGRWTACTKCWKMPI